MGDVVPLRTKHQAEVLDMLERAKERLVAGELKGLIMVSFTQDGDNFTSISGGTTLSDMAYAVMVLQAECQGYLQTSHNQEGPKNAG